MKSRSIDVRTRRRCLAGLVALALFAGAGAAAQAQRSPAEPEAATPVVPHALVTARRHMVVAANPYASRAGLEILRAGGSALDAAIAVQLVLGLVEPQSSGLGGGAFIVAWDAGARRISTYDGREAAPAAARPDRFVTGSGPMPFAEAVASGRSVGVPGVARAMALAHERHGVLPWARLFEPAIRLAEEGFEVSPRLNVLLALEGRSAFAPAARRYFFDEAGRAWPAGHRLRNPELAATLRRLAAEGAVALYGGPIGDAIVAAVQGAASPGDLTHADLLAYKARERPPVCVPYRARKVCGMGPPSSGGLAIGMALRLLAPFDLGEGPGAAMAPAAVHLIAEAERIAYADRDRYIGDPDHVAVPSGLVDPAYLEARRALIDPQRAAVKVEAGRPPGLGIKSFGEDATTESPGTSHISVIDGRGNAVAMTTTIEQGFGSRLWAAGFLLNNQLTDFSFIPVDADGRIVANAVGPGRRPRSSMAPTIVFGSDGRVEAVVGSPGGSRIILYVLKTLVGLLDWQLDAETAAALPNFGSRGGPLEVELTFAAGAPFRALLGFGHRLAPDPMTSGLALIVVRRGLIEGGADPRREGLAVGD